MGQEIVLWIRPGIMEGTEAVSGHVDSNRVMRVEVDLVKELGSEILVHFSLPVRSVITPDIKELLEDQGECPESLGNRAKLTAEVSPRVDVNEGQHLDLLIDAEFWHYFDLENGMAIT